MVLQDTWLFGGTIRDNIAYGRPIATEEEILEAAQATYVDRFVHSLPDGYDTVLDDEGANVSAGEKQLLTIARAFLARPVGADPGRGDVLGGHPDRGAGAEGDERAAVATGPRFVIAHRLSTIRDADLILVMEAGQIVEQGTHASLLAAGGAYARAVRGAVRGAGGGGLGAGRVSFQSRAEFSTDAMPPAQMSRVMSFSAYGVPLPMAAKTAAPHPRALLHPSSVAAVRLTGIGAVDGDDPPLARGMSVLDAKKTF